MFTLKIAWHRIDENGIQADETVLYIAADHVRTHGPVVEVEGETPTMKHWQQADWEDYRNTCDGKDGDLNADGPVRSDGRLIMVERDGESSWYVASRAWLLGPTGTTIERIAP